MNMVAFVGDDYTLRGKDDQNPSQDMVFVPVITFQFMAENSPLALSTPSRKSLPARQTRTTLTTSVQNSGIDLCADR